MKIILTSGQLRPAGGNNEAGGNYLAFPWRRESSCLKWKYLAPQRDINLSALVEVSQFGIWPQRLSPPIVHKWALAKPWNAKMGQIPTQLWSSQNYWSNMENGGIFLEKSFSLLLWHFLSEIRMIHWGNWSTFRKSNLGSNRISKHWSGSILYFKEGILFLLLSY